MTHEIIYSGTMEAYWACTCLILGCIFTLPVERDASSSLHWSVYQQQMSKTYTLLGTCIQLFMVAMHQIVNFRSGQVIFLVASCTNPYLIHCVCTIFNVYYNIIIRTPL